MNLLECTKVNTFFEFTKQNGKIFKKKLFWFCKQSIWSFDESRPACLVCPGKRMQNGRDEKKIEKSVVNVLCSSKNDSIFAADFAAHVLLTVDAHALVKSRV